MKSIPLLFISLPGHLIYHDLRPHVSRCFYLFSNCQISTPYFRVNLKDFFIYVQTIHSVLFAKTNFAYRPDFSHKHTYLTVLETSLHPKDYCFVAFIFPNPFLLYETHFKLPYYSLLLLSYLATHIFTLFHARPFPVSFILCCGFIPQTTIY